MNGTTTLYDFNVTHDVLIIPVEALDICIFGLKQEMVLVADMLKANSLLDESLKLFFALVQTEISQLLDGVP